MNFNHDSGLIESILTLNTSVSPPLGGDTGSLLITGTGAITVPVGSTAQEPTVAGGKIRYDSTTNKLRWSNNVAWADLSTGGTVTSVGLQDSSSSAIYTITNSPVTTTGTLTMTLATQTTNKVFASPNGSTGQPTFRALVASDIPSLSYLPLAGGSMNSAANITMVGGGTITGLPTTPSGNTDAVSKSYVDATASSLTVHTAVEAASITAYTVTYNNGTAGVGATLTNAGTQTAFSIDSYSAPVTARVLIKNQATQTQNGVYTVTDEGSGSTNWILTRATDFDNSIAGEARAGAFVFVSEGSTLLKTGWVETGIGTGTGDDLVFGTDNLVFTQFSGAGTYTASLPLVITGGSNFTISGLSTYGTANQIIGMNNAANAAEYKTFNGTTDQISIAHAANSVTYSLANNVVLPGTGAMTVVSGATGTEPGFAAGLLRYDTTTNKLRYSDNAAWANIGTVTTVSVTTANGVSGSVATASTTPAISLTLGAITPTSVNGLTLAALGTGFTIAGGTTSKTLQLNNSLTLAGTDATVMTFPTTSATIARIDAANTFTGIQTMTSPALTTPAITGISTGTGVATSATVNTLTLRDANGNITAVNFLPGFATTVTAGGTTTLTVNSAYIQEFTGTAAQTIVLPVTTTLVVGQTWNIVNKSTQSLIVNSSGANLVQTIATGSSAIITCVVASGTGAASWDSQYIASSGTGTVTSVGLQDSSSSAIYTITNSPVTTTGTLTMTLATQTTNKVFASPNGSTGQPTFRALAQADLSFLALYKENASTPTAPTAGGTNAVSIGTGASATATNAFAVGDGTDSRIWGGRVTANGKFATAGDAQTGNYTLRAITTNATPTEIFLDGAGATQRLVLPDNSVCTFTILLAARRTDAVGGGAAYKFEGAFRKDSTSASLTTIGSPSKVILGETDAVWDANISADTTNGSIKILVTGEAAKTIRWVATVITSEVTD